jgi:hypothetical protein
MKILFNLKTRMKFKFIFWIFFLYWNQGYVIGSVQEPTQPRLCFYGMILHLGEEGKGNDSFYLHYYLMSRYGCSEENSESMIWRTMKFQVWYCFWYQIVCFLSNNKHWFQQQLAPLMVQKCKFRLSNNKYNIFFSTQFLNVQRLCKGPISIYYWILALLVKCPIISFHEKFLICREFVGFLYQIKYFYQLKKTILSCDLWKIKYTFHFNRTDYPSGFNQKNGPAMHFLW